MAHTIKLSTLVASDNQGARPFVEALKNALKTPQTPAKTGYWLGKLSAVCEKEVAAFDEVRNRLIRELGVPVEGKEDTVQVPFDKMEHFATELNSLDRDIDLGLPDELKLALPPVITPSEWNPLIAVLDIFEEPK